MIQYENNNFKCNVEIFGNRSLQINSFYTFYIHIYIIKVYSY